MENVPPLLILGGMINALSVSVNPDVWKLNIETRGAPPGPARATATSRPLASLATPALIVPLYPANTFVTGMPVGSLFKITPN